MLDDYVVIDLEMTGLAPKKDHILETGAVRVRAGEVVAEHTAILRVPVSLPDEVVRLTGITQEQSECGRDPGEAMEELFSFLGDDVLVGQNVIFDYSFLKQWAINHCFPFERTAVDTLKLARRFLPAEQKKDLESLCAYFGIRREHAHRALHDARETWQILERLKQEFGGQDAQAFLPRELRYHAKRQTPATRQQREYLERFARYHGIAIEEDLSIMTRGEMSRLTDLLIAKHGRMRK